MERTGPPLPWQQHLGELALVLLLGSTVRPLGLEAWEQASWPQRHGNRRADPTFCISWPSRAVLESSPCRLTGSATTQAPIQSLELAHPQHHL